MSYNVTLNREEKNLKQQQKRDEREVWHKIVVKILSWKDGISENSSIKSDNKITKKEWKIYTENMLERSITDGKEKTLKKLAELKSLIQKHGGFE